MKTRAEFYKVFRRYSHIELERAERVFSSLLEALDGKSMTYRYGGIRITELKCLGDDVRLGLPVLKALKEPVVHQKMMVGALELATPTEEVEITKNGTLTGYYNIQMIRGALTPLRQYLGETKKVKQKKISLTLSRTGLRNDENGKNYPLTGEKMRAYLVCLHKERHLSEEILLKRVDQTSGNLTNGIKRLNSVALTDLKLVEPIIITQNGYTLNPRYNIKIQEE